MTDKISVHGKGLIGMKCSALLFFFGFYAILLSAQPYTDIVNLKYQYFPERKYKDAATIRQTSSLAEASILLPVVLKRDVLLLGGRFRQMDFETSVDLNAKVYDVTIPLGYEFRPNKKNWKVLATFLPRWIGDFEGSGSDCFQPGGLLLFKYKLKKDLRIHLGMYYNKEFFGNYFIALAGIDWKINNNLNLFGNFPSTMTLEYKADSSFFFGIAYASFVSSYRISSNNSASNYYLREGTKSWGHIHGKAFINFVVKKIVFYAEAGMSFNRNMQLYSNLNDDALSHPVYRKTENGVLFTGGIAYRIRHER